MAKCGRLQFLHLGPKGKQTDLGPNETGPKRARAFGRAERALGQTGQAQMGQAQTGQGQTDQGQTGQGLGP